MLRGMTSVVVGLGFAAAAVAGPVPKGAKKADFFPVTLGHKWERLQDDDVVTTEVTKAEPTADGTLYTFTYTGEKKQPATKTWVYRVKDDDVFSVQADAWIADKPGLIAKRAMKSGDTWDGEHRWQGLEATAWTHVVGDAKKLKTPAGEFHAIPVERRQEGKPTEVRWYADRVGMVRREIGGKLDSELKSFTPGR